MSNKNLKKVLAVTHLYLFPGAILRRGGLIIHDSLVNLKDTGRKVDVILLLPINYIRDFKFNWKKLTFSSYTINDIEIVPIFYIPRISKLSPKFDVYLKTLLIKIFYRSKKLNNYDLIYSQTLYPDGPIAHKLSANYKIPFIVNLRGSDVHTFSAYNKQIFNQSLQTLVSSNLVMAVSEKLKEIAFDIFGKNYINHILYTVCQTQIFKRQKPISESLNKIIYIGALVNAKGIYDLIEAVSQLSRYKQYQLTLVGGGGNRKQLEKIIKTKGLTDQVFFKGKISKRNELANEINKADILLFPSHKEGLPNVVVEGVACERAVITTDVGGVHEIVSQNMAYQIVPPKNVSSIVEAVLRLDEVNLTELRQQASYNRQELIKRFSSESQLLSFNKMINKIKF